VRLCAVRACWEVASKSSSQGLAARLSAPVD
jgi:hypothetical protein